MNLEAELHSQWASKSTLAALLPGERVFTGRAPPETHLPFATLLIVGAQPALRTSSGATVTDVVVRFSIHIERFADGAAIAAALASRDDGFLGATFAFDGGDVLDVQQRNERRESSPHGVWTFDVELAFRVVRS